MPEPDGPTRATRSPAAMSKLTPSKTQRRRTANARRVGRLDQERRIFRFVLIEADTRLIAILPVVEPHVPVTTSPVCGGVVTGLADSTILGEMSKTRNTRADRRHAVLVHPVDLRKPTHRAVQDADITQERRELPAVNGLAPWIAS